MESWAALYATTVQFLCVCVESRQVAQLFSRSYTFRHALNGYIPSQQYFPVGYGQLGCAGFIIVDAQGCFVGRKTKAFLDYGEDAFRDVEDILQRLVGSSASSSTTTANLEPKTAATTTTTNTLAQHRIEAPPSVGVQSMDTEHATCTAAINAFLAAPTSRAHLSAVLRELQEHFDHEDVLLQRYTKSRQQESRFSALTSHMQDHQRILDIGREALQPAVVLASNDGC